MGNAFSSVDKGSICGAGRVDQVGLAVSREPHTHEGAPIGEPLRTPAAALPRDFSSALRFHELPSDILVRVSHHLAARDVFNLAAVSTSTRHVATSDVCWRHHIDSAFIPAGFSAYEMAKGMGHHLVNGDGGILRPSGQGLVQFTHEGESRPGSVRVVIPPGNRTVAHLEEGQADLDLGVPAFQLGSANWVRFRDLETPGRNTLALRGVCWLDVQSEFKDLPPGKWVFSWHVRFRTEDGAWKHEFELEFSVEAFAADGSLVRTAYFGRPFLNREGLKRDWLRHDVSMEVREGESAIVLSAYHKVCIGSALYS